MTFCVVVSDESDAPEPFCFEHFMNLPSSKELSFSNSLLGTPGRQASTSLSGWPLAPIQEEGVDSDTLAVNQVDSWLGCCQDSSVGVGCVTPQDVHAYAVQYPLLKNSFEFIQLSLLEYPMFQEWSTKHEPLE